MLLHVAVALSLALPGPVLSRRHQGLAMEEGYVYGQAGAAGLLLGAHSSGWATGADEEGVTGVGGALRRLTQNRSPAVSLPGTDCTTPALNRVSRMCGIGVLRKIAKPPVLHPFGQIRTPQPQRTLHPTAP